MSISIERLVEWRSEVTVKLRSQATDNDYLVAAPARCRICGWSDRTKVNAIYFGDCVWCIARLDLG